MSSSEPFSGPGGPRLEDAPAMPMPRVVPSERRGARLGVLALVAGLLAGLISWGVEEFDLKVSDPTLAYNRAKGVSLAVASKELRQLRRAATIRTAELSYGLLGGLVGLGLGLAGGVAGRSWVKGLIAGLVGLAVGAGGGAIASWALVPRYLDAAAEGGPSFDDELVFPLLIHLGLWVSAGIAGGLALGVAGGSWRRAMLALLGGVLGAALGTVLYEFGAALAFPAAEANLPIANHAGARLLAHVCVGVLAALGAAVLAQYLALTGATENMRIAT